ncbi:hypothetical protein FM105_05615 [Brevibacterium yomogidense]|uniref:Uncharacterized protein n=1 Tax=Brevibacterium yomogidense TaxID=946573 RepID=A0A1X6XAL5_9MICO|nr:hypothetical protein FM105_05615 [Brevibacterium yomogidense]
MVSQRVRLVSGASALRSVVIPVLRHVCPGECRLSWSVL